MHMTGVREIAVQCTRLFPFCSFESLHRSFIFAPSYKHDFLLH